MKRTLASQAEHDTEKTPFVTHQQYRHRTSEIKANFEKGVGELYLPSASSDARRMVFEMAWEEGHSEGFYRVETIYASVAEIVEKVLEKGADRAEGAE